MILREKNWGLRGLAYSSAVLEDFFTGDFTGDLLGTLLGTFRGLKSRICQMLILTRFIVFFVLKKENWGLEIW